MTKSFRYNTVRAKWTWGFRVTTERFAWLMVAAGAIAAFLAEFFLIEFSLAKIVICTAAVGVFGLACVKQRDDEKTLRTMLTKRKSHSRKN
jgi:hypothetical protein